MTGLVAILLVDILFPHAMESTFYKGHFHRTPELGFIPNILLNAYFGDIVGVLMTFILECWTLVIE